MESIRVLVVDDNAHIRRVIADVLASEPDIQVVGEAVDGDEALRVLGLLAPHVLLMDMCIPGLSGLDATRQVRASAPSVAVLIMAEMSNHEYIESAMQAGANGFLLKERLMEEMVTALRVLRQSDPMDFRHLWH